MIKVDAVGQTCPVPVIMTKKALKEVKEGIVEVSVDNRTSKENIEKFAKEMGYETSIREREGIFFISITKNDQLSINNTLPSNDNNTVIVISSDKMGEGENDLGETLMKAFIYTLTEIENLPKTILFYNKGVLLTTTNENTIKDLKSLENKGVQILSCGACLNFYNVENSLKVGTVTNMYTIIDKQIKATKVIKP